jgi:hypothetical protein
MMIAVFEARRCTRIGSIGVVVARPLGHHVAVSPAPG